MVLQYTIDIDGHSKEFMTRPFDCSCDNGSMHLAAPVGVFNDAPSHHPHFSEACKNCPGNPCRGFKYKH